MKYRTANCTVVSNQITRKEPKSNDRMSKLGFKPLPILGRLQNLLLPLYFQGNVSLSDLYQIWSLFALSSPLEPKILWIQVKLSVKVPTLVNKNTLFIVLIIQGRVIVLPYCLPSTTYSRTKKKKSNLGQIVTPIKVISLCLQLFLL